MVLLVIEFQRACSRQRAQWLKTAAVELYETQAQGRNKPRNRPQSNLQFLDFLRASMSQPLAFAARDRLGIIGRYYAAPDADMRGTRESLEAALEAAGIEVIDRATFFSELKVAGDPDICGNSFYVSRFEGDQYMVNMTGPAKTLVDAEIARRGADATVDGPYNVGGRHKFFLVTTMSDNAQASLLKAAVSTVADRRRKRKRQAPMISETVTPPWATNVPSSDYLRDALQLNEDLINRGVPDDLRLKAAQFIADGEWKTLQELQHLRKELGTSLQKSEAGRAIKVKVMRLFYALNSVLHLAERRRRDWLQADGEPEPWRYAEPPPPPPPQRKADEGTATAPAPAQAELDDRDCPLVCPIAMDGHMREPVTLPCGCNFEKESVTEWFRTESSCPTCRKKMPRGFDASTLGVNKLIQQNAASLCKCKVFSRD